MNASGRAPRPPPSLAEARCDHKAAGQKWGVLAVFPRSTSVVRRRRRRLSSSMRCAQCLSRAAQPSPYSAPFGGPVFDRASSSLPSSLLAFDASSSPVRVVRRRRGQIAQCAQKRARITAKRAVGGGDRGGEGRGFVRWRRPEERRSTIFNCVRLPPPTAQTRAPSVDGHFPPAVRRSHAHSSSRAKSEVGSSCAARRPDVRHAGGIDRSRSPMARRGEGTALGRAPTPLPPTSGDTLVVGAGRQTAAL